MPRPVRPQACSGPCPCASTAPVFGVPKPRMRPAGGPAKPVRARRLRVRNRACRRSKISAAGKPECRRHLRAPWPQMRLYGRSAVRSARISAANGFVIANGTSFRLAPRPRRRPAGSPASQANRRLRPASEGPQKAHTNGRRIRPLASRARMTASERDPLQRGSQGEGARIAVPPAEPVPSTMASPPPAPRGWSRPRPPPVGSRAARPPLEAVAAPAARDRGRPHTAPAPPPARRSADASPSARTARYPSRLEEQRTGSARGPPACPPALPPSAARRSSHRDRPSAPPRRHRRGIPGCGRAPCAAPPPAPRPARWISSPTSAAAPARCANCPPPASRRAVRPARSAACASSCRSRAR